MSLSKIIEYLIYVGVVAGLVTLIHHTSKMKGDDYNYKIYSENRAYRSLLKPEFNRTTGCINFLSNYNNAIEICDRYIIVGPKKASDETTNI